jgi:hypothetical protein
MKCDFQLKGEVQTKSDELTQDKVQRLKGNLALKYNDLFQILMIIYQI